MRRSTLMILLGSMFFSAAPAFAQQPTAPPEQYGQPGAQPQYGQEQYPQQYPQQPYPQQQYGDGSQPMDPYGDADDEDEGYDVTYDISTQPQDDEYDDGYDPNAYQQFQSQLSPYGSWESVPNYGQVWVPSPSVVGADFSPYESGGRFVMSDYGWTWVSDWDWGWAPFHYGRWMVINGYGWSWIPGTVWGPAWVSWRWGGGYVGWAPMAPRGVIVGAPRGVRCPWHFTVAAQLGARRVSYLPARVVPSVWSHTSVVVNARNVNLGGTTVRVAAGPPAHVVAAAVGHPVTPVALATTAPRALPRATIAPHVGTPVQARPWMQGRPTAGPRPIGTTLPGGARMGGGNPQAPRPLYNQAPRPVYNQPYHAAQPTYHAPTYTQPTYRAPTYAQPTYRAPTYAQPTYHAPTNAQPVYHPTYNAPTYHAPTYSAPTYHEAAPTYSATPSYHAPSYSAPTYHAAPSGGGGFHAGSFGGGGHHR